MKRLYISMPPDLTMMVDWRQIAARSAAM